MKSAAKNAASQGATLAAVAGILILTIAVPCAAADHVVMATQQNQMPRFDPRTVTIEPGDTVTFVNHLGNHNVVADDGAFRCANGCDQDGGNGNLADNAWRATVRFSDVGEYGYYCEPHGNLAGGMRGKVIVADATAPPPPPPTGGVPIDAGFTGEWYNADQSGHGFYLEVLPNNIMVLAWFVYDDAGAPAWIVAQGIIDGDVATLDGVVAAGGFFPPAFDPDAITRTPWGQFTFRFSDCNNGHVDWTATAPGFSSGSLDLIRLTLPAGLACPHP